MSTFLFLNTKDRAEGTNEDATFNIPASQIYGGQQLTLESMQFPHMMYPISEERGNHIIYFYEAATPATIRQAMVAVNVNYDLTSFADAIEVAMLAAGTAATIVTVRDSVNLKLTLNGIAAPTIVDGPFSMHNEMGYDLTQGALLALTMANPVDLSGTKYIDVIARMGSHYSYNSTGTYTVLSRVPVLSNFGAAVLHNPSLKMGINVNSSMPSIRLSLRDDRGRKVQMGSNAFISYSFMLSAIE
jgi:hypothetical protein